MFHEDILGPLLGIGATAGAGLLTKEAYDRLEDIGEQAVLGTDVGGQRIPGSLEMAKEALELSQFRPFTVTSATGGRFGVTPQVDPATGAVTGTGVELAVSPEEQALQTGLMGGAEQFFGQAMTPTAQREQEVFNRIRATQVAEEERQRLALEERLASQGRLGVRTSMFGGTPEQLALAQAQEEARNRASLMALQQAQAEQAQQAALGSQFLGASYVPQSQMLNVQQASQLFPQLQQQAQLFGAGQFGETQMSGLEARLIAEQARANLLGNIGSGLLGGLFSPVAMAGGGIGTGIGSLFEIGKNIVTGSTDTGSTT
jgi:hypothetical protein